MNGNAISFGAPSMAIGSGRSITIDSAISVGRSLGASFRAYTSRIQPRQGTGQGQGFKVSADLQSKKRPPFSKGDRSCSEFYLITYRQCKVNALTKQRVFVAGTRRLARIRFHQEMMGIFPEDDGWFECRLHRLNELTWAEVFSLACSEMYSALAKNGLTC